MELLEDVVLLEAVELLVDEEELVDEIEVLVEEVEVVVEVVAPVSTHLASSVEQLSVTSVYPVGHVQLRYCDDVRHVFVAQVVAPAVETETVR